METLRPALRNPVVVVSGAFIVLYIVSALFAPLIVSHAPDTMDTMARLSPPSQEHPLGTDQFGRDVLSRVIYGGRVSLQVALVAVFAAVIVGGALGMIMGYVGGLFDVLAARILDILISFPSLLLALFLVAVLGPDLVNLVLALSLTRMPYFARLTRAEVSSMKARPFIEASRATGASHVRILIRHILPNLLPLLIVFATTDVATAIIAESSLSYLGLGTQPPTPSWGRMLTEARAFFGQAIWLALFPGLAIMLTVIAFNLFGDGLRDAIDPRLRGR